MSRKEYGSLKNDENQASASKAQEQDRQFKDNLQTTVLAKGFNLKDSLTASFVALASAGTLSKNTVSIGDKAVNGYTIRIGSVAVIYNLATGDIRDLRSETGIEGSFNGGGLINLETPQFNCEGNKLLILDQMLKRLLTEVVGREEASAKILVAEKMEDVRLVISKQSASRGKEEEAESSAGPQLKPQDPTSQQLAPQQASKAK